MGSGAVPVAYEDSPEITADTTLCVVKCIIVERSNNHTMIQLVRRESQLADNEGGARQDCVGAYQHYGTSYDEIEMLEDLVGTAPREHTSTNRHMNMQQ